MTVPANFQMCLRNSPAGFRVYRLCTLTHSGICTLGVRYAF